MVAKIKEYEVAGLITSNGKCPSCFATLRVRDTNYTFTKNNGLAVFDNGEQYIKCKCGRFVMLPGKAA